MICTLYNYKGTVIYKTDTVEKMNDFMKEDGANYNIINIMNFENDYRIDFESGSQLFLITTENKM
jgi:hypothetical protein